MLKPILCLLNSTPFCKKRVCWMFKQLLLKFVVLKTYIFLVYSLWTDIFFGRGYKRREPRGEVSGEEKEIWVEGSKFSLFEWREASQYSKYLFLNFSSCRAEKNNLNLPTCGRMESCIFLRAWIASSRFWNSRNAFKIVFLENIMIFERGPNFLKIWWRAFT